MKGVFAVMNAAIHGIILAFGLILPLGAQNVLIFQQGASSSSIWRVMPLVITASLCDSLLIILAVTGISAAVAGLPEVKIVLLAGGVLFLIYMGWATWRSKPAVGSASESMPSKKQIAFAAAVSLLNPHALLDIVGVIGTNSLAYEGADLWLFTCACMMVSWLWFLGLTAAGRLLKQLDSQGFVLTLFNKGSAAVMWGLAAYLGASLFT